MPHGGPDDPDIIDIPQSWLDAYNRLPETDKQVLRAARKAMQALADQEHLDQPTTEHYKAQVV